MTGPQYLVELTLAAAGTQQAGQYAATLVDLYRRREAILGAQDTIEALHDVDLDRPAETIIEEAQGGLDAILGAGDRGGLEPLGNRVEGALEQIQDAYKAQGTGAAGLCTGLKSLDKLIGGLKPGKLYVLAGATSMGKAQPLDAKILTPVGWATMRDLKPGDELASVDGRRSLVSGVFPQGQKQIYRVTFSDGRFAECCGEHLWRVNNRGWREARVLSTNDLEGLLKRPSYEKRLRIDTFNGDFGHEQSLPIDSWLLGVLLGDGAFHGGTANITSVDEEIVHGVAAAVGDGLILSKTVGDITYRIVGVKAKNCEYCGVEISGGHRSRKWCSALCCGRAKWARRVAYRDHGTPMRRSGSQPNQLVSKLEKLGIWNLLSTEKFIPGIYLTAPRADRLALLRGLLDTDGSIETHGTVRFYSSSERLAGQVVDLARSLGGWVTKRAKTTHYRTSKGILKRRPSWVVNICSLPKDELFTLGRKRERAGCPVSRTRKPTILSIVPTRIADATCISVTHPSRQYITDDFVVTHNTAAAEGIAFNAARSGQRPAFFSLEMTAEDVIQREISRITGIDSKNINNGWLSEAEMDQVVQCREALAALPLHIDDTSTISVAGIRARARRMQRAGGLDLVVIDYLQLMGDDRRPHGMQRYEEIGQMTRQIKTGIAKELRVPVILLSQLSRQVDSRDDHRPRLPVLRESGSIEQDADVVMFLYREEYYLRNEKPQRRGNETDETFERRERTWYTRLEDKRSKAEIIVAKQRNGPTGSVTVEFDGPRMRFHEGDAAEQENQEEIVF
jgi:replicative DNA helicase